MTITLSDLKEQIRGGQPLTWVERLDNNPGQAVSDLTTFMEQYCPPETAHPWKAVVYSSNAGIAFIYEADQGNFYALRYRTPGGSAAAEMVCRVARIKPPRNWPQTRLAQTMNSSMFVTLTELDGDSPKVHAFTLPPSTMAGAEAFPALPPPPA